jgi:hypothetical protein
MMAESVMSPAMTTACTAALPPVLPDEASVPPRKSPTLTRVRVMDAASS